MRNGAGYRRRRVAVLNEMSQQLLRNCIKSKKKFGERIVKKINNIVICVTFVLFISTVGEVVVQ